MAKTRIEALDIEPADLGPDPQKAGAGVFAFGTALSVLWLAAAGFSLVTVVGLDTLRNAGPLQAISLGLMVITPAFLILFAAAAAREGARGRAHAARLTEAAERLHNPSPAAEAAARRLGVSVRGEIAALDRALDHVGQKLREVEAVIARQTLAVDNAAAAAEAGARQMVTGLERERNDLLGIADDLHNQARLIGEGISRHTKMISDAARVAEAEVRSADEALDSRLSSFGAAAALISDRTHALNTAAQQSAEASLRLEGALSNSLDALAKATSLTDAARQSAEAATLAANSTAGAIRETTQRAVEEARRAAELIRAEAAAIVGLRDGASAGAGGGHTPQGGQARAQESRQQESRAQEPSPPQRRASQGFLGGGSPRGGETPPTTAPRPGDPAVADNLSNFSPRPAAPNGAQKPAGSSDRWTWRDVLASVDDEDTDAVAPSQRTAPAAAREPDRARPQTFAERRSATTASNANAYDARQAQERAAQERASQDRASQDRIAAQAAVHAAADARSRPAPSTPGGAIIEAAGVRLGEVFALPALERIAQKARGGTQARRRAVREAAPESVLRLANHLDADARARAEAAAFLGADGARIAELLTRGRASMSADATRAFLLIDAAAS